MHTARLYRLNHPRAGKREPRATATGSAGG
uniref:Uncharacterized protein n=1 Tax=Anguilla anguilla TaxID=7936 RepID=A0A0E9UR01_ANGAN